MSNTSTSESTYPQYGSATGSGALSGAGSGRTARSVVGAAPTGRGGGVSGGAADEAGQRESPECSGSDARSECGKGGLEHPELLRGDRGAGAGEDPGESGTDSREAATRGDGAELSGETGDHHPGAGEPGEGGEGEATGDPHPRLGGAPVGFAANPIQPDRVRAQFAEIDGCGELGGGGRIRRGGRVDLDRAGDDRNAGRRRPALDRPGEHEGIARVEFERAAQAIDAI